MKSVVSWGYDAIAAAYEAARTPEAPPMLGLLTDRLPPSGAVLDIGCGSGVPVARTLAERFAVTGVDISAEQAARTRERVPAATVIHGDIMTQAFADASFDGVVMLYSLFHLPAEEQPELLARIARWLRPGGYLLATLADGDSEYTEPFHGSVMAWSERPLAQYRRWLDEAGLTIVVETTTGHGYKGDDAPTEVHPLVLARMTASGEGIAG